MNKIGSIRRLDELGRLVIPKEIRNIIHAKSGDTFEIYLNNEEIILKKYSPLNNIESLANTIAQTLNKNLKTEVIITSKDKIIISKSNNINKNDLLSEEIISLIEIHKNLLFHSKKILVTQNTSKYGDFILCPLTSSGDNIGSIIIYSSSNLKEEDMKIIKILSQIISENTSE